MSKDCVHDHAANPAGERAGKPLGAGRYYGAIGDRFEIPHAVLSRVVHPAARALPEHDHALAYFCMLLDGNYIESVANREFDYKPFEVGFHPARVSHRDAVGNRGGEFLCLEIRAEPFVAAEVRLRKDPALLPGDVSLQLLRVCRSFANRTLSAVELESAVWELCGDASDEPACRERRAPRWLRRCLEIIEGNYAESLTVAGIAADLGIHPVHTSREFRRRFGQTLGEYLNKVRIRAACAAMSRQSQPLAAVAAGAGFADQAHFCRVFKSLVGCTPSAFAATVRPTRH
jgi:AraC family transcriptional regulator